MRKIIRTITVVIVLLFVYMFIIRTAESNNGKKAPGFTAELITGEAFSLEELRGRYVLLDFWGSWCAPCRKESPELVKLYNRFKDKTFSDAEGIEVVSVALEKSGDYWRKEAEAQGFNWPYQIVQHSRVVLMSPLAQKYSVRNIPAKFLIDPEGRILSVNASFDELNAFLASKQKNI